MQSSRWMSVLGTVSCLSIHSCVIDHNLRMKSSRSSKQKKTDTVVAGKGFILKECCHPLGGMCSIVLPCLVPRLIIWL